MRKLNISAKKTAISLISLLIAIVAFAAVPEKAHAAHYNNFSYVERSWNESANRLELEQLEFFNKHTAAEFRGWVDELEDDGEVTLTTGWWVNADWKAFDKSRVKIDGNVHLVLENHDLLCNKGIYVPEGSTLTIYCAYSGWDDNCKLYAKTDKGNEGAAIGGNNGSKGGTIIIKGGNIIARPGDGAAGIGGGDHGDGGVSFYFCPLAGAEQQDGADDGHGQHQEGLV